MHKPRLLPLLATLYVVLLACLVLLTTRCGHAAEPPDLTPNPGVKVCTEREATYRRAGQYYYDQSQGRGLVLDEIQTLLRGLHQLEADQKQRLKEGGTP